MGTVLGALKNKNKYKKIIQNPGLDLLYVRHFLYQRKGIVLQYLRFVMDLKD